ncbi:MAG: DUF2807 domain-containing protein, partial [Bacteroidales bacterium]|nr:DUF2807 domain-containing protein [Bacteroidales bacterium]
QQQLSIGEQQIKGIILEGPWDVVITQDSTSNSALLEYSLAAENRVSAELRSNGYLYLKVNPLRGRTWHRVFRAKISATSLEKIAASGAADIETYGNFALCKDISLSGASEIEGLICTGENLEITLSGASRIEDFTFRGNRIDADIAGASKIILDNANLNYCKVVCSGASTFQASGYATETSFDGGGSSDFNTLDFETDDLDIMLSGASSTKVTVNNSISGILSGA